MMDRLDVQIPCPMSDLNPYLLWLLLLLVGHTELLYLYIYKVNWLATDITVLDRIIWFAHVSIEKKLDYNQNDSRQNVFFSFFCIKQQSYRIFYN